MSMSVEEFLQRKGGVGILSVLNERGKTFSRIESEVAISSDTVSKRKDQAMDIGLIDIRPAKQNGRTVTEYHLTEFGEAVTEKLAKEGVVSNYLSMRTHQRKVQEKTNEVVDWLTENPDYFLHFPEVSEETLIDRSADPGETTEESLQDQDFELPDDVPSSAGTEDSNRNEGDGEEQTDRTQRPINDFDFHKYAESDKASSEGGETNDDQ